MSTDADIIIALARKLEAQNPSTLEAENATLRRERDQLKTDAMSDLINRHRLENQVRNREAERDLLRAENEALRAGQGRWPEGDSPAGEQVPRVINADELHSGVSVASFTDHGTPVAGIVTGEATDKVTLRIRNDDLISLDTERRFILLADAPVRIDIPSEQVRFKGVTDLRYKGSAPAPRLTVHALNTAPVGSRVTTPNITWAKADDETWFTASAFGQQARTSEELHALVYANATLMVNESNEKGADQ